LHRARPGAFPEELEMKSLYSLCAAGILAGCATHPVQPEVPIMSQRSASSPVKRGHLPVNGLHMYYEVHGAGDGVPLVLLHGGGSTIDVTYGRVLPYLAQHRRVIAVEEQAHGRTSDRDQPERFESSADDVAALLAQLGVTSADVMGFSNGASVALQVAIRHRGLVRRLVFASSMTKRSGASPAFWDGIAHATFEDMPQPLKDAFLQVTPDPRKLRQMYERDVERMRSFRDVSDADVASLKVPVLILSGDRDVPTVEHAVELTRLWPHARLVILPGGHGDYLGELLASPGGSRYAEMTAWLIERFLDGPA
jgi:pimeloyl-ACP methyl ester carboxylesterase